MPFTKAKYLAIRAIAYQNCKGLYPHCKSDFVSKMLLDIIKLVVETMTMVLDWAKRNTTGPTITINHRGTTKMMKILPGVSLLLSLHSIDSYSQSLDAELEDIGLIRESLRTHTISDSRAESSRLILTVLKLDLERNGAEFLNLDPRRESVALTMLSTLDLRRIERDAIAPIMADMCFKLESGSADAVELASIYLQAEQAQNQAVDAAYDSIIESLSDDGRVVVERIRETTAGDKRQLKFDWKGIARDAPVFVKGVLQNACIELSKPVTENTPSPTMPSNSTLSDGFSTN